MCWGEGFVAGPSRIEWPRQAMVVTAAPTSLAQIEALVNQLL
jgi:hypothetical protein